MIEIPEDSNLDSAIRFTRHNFDNLQSLVRLADAKAGGILTIWVLMVGSTFAMGHQVFSSIRWCYWGTWHVILAMTIVLLAGLLLVLAILIFQRVIFPRRPYHYSDTIRERDLMYFEHILKHETPDRYRSAIANMNASIELRNLCDQVYELAHVVNQKMTGLRTCCKWLIFSVAIWFVLGTFLIFIG